MKSLKNVAQRKLITDLRDKNPNMTMQDIANIVSLSRERVRQILESENRQTYRVKPQYYCRACGKLIIKSYNKQYCNRLCRTTDSLITVRCDCGCGLIFERSGNLVRRTLKSPKYKGHFFLNRVHYLRWCGNNFGFGIHPENSLRYKGKGK